MQNKDTKRFTVSISEGHAEHLAALAKLYKLNQGEIIEVLLEIATTRHLSEAAIKRREEKVNSRTSINAVVQRMRKEKAAAKNNG